MTLAEEFDLRYPEFLLPPPGQTAATAPQIAYWLAEAEAFLCPERLGANYRPAVLAWAAAQVARALKQVLNGAAVGESGPVASAAVGGESVSYSSNSKYGTGTAADRKSVV